MNKRFVRNIIQGLFGYFEGEVPTRFKWNGQTFSERVEAWALHAIERLESELEGFNAGERGDQDFDGDEDDDEDDND